MHENAYHNFISEDSRWITDNINLKLWKWLTKKQGPNGYTESSKSPDAFTEP